MKTIFLIIGIFSLTFVHAQNKAESSIRELLDKQTQFWNEGNIDSFMSGYWNDDSLLFIGQSGPTYGFQNTLQNYKKTYPNATAMGKLSFNILKVEPLSKQVYFVVGKWSLVRSIGNVSGHFSLLFKKIKGKWLIIADHSS